MKRVLWLWPFTIIPFAACDSGDEAECPVGAETCPCTPGGSCDPGLECLSNFCVGPSSELSSAGTGTSSAGDSSQASAGETNQGSAGDPSQGSGGDRNLSPGGEPGVATSVGGSSPGGNLPAACVVPAGSFTVTRQVVGESDAEPPGGAPKDSFSASFAGDGSLQELDAMSCELDAERPANLSGDLPCVVYYLCGACEIRVAPLDKDSERTVTISGNQSCSDYNAQYEACVGDCSEPECGPNLPCMDVNEICSDGVCKCPSGCQPFGLSICCGGTTCGQDCIGTPCCT